MTIALYRDLICKASFWTMDHYATDVRVCQTGIVSKSGDIFISLDTISACRTDCGTIKITYVKYYVGNLTECVPANTFFIDDFLKLFCAQFKRTLN